MTRPDIIVVGAGPAGLAAARAAADAGARVTLVDDRPAPGGQYHSRRAAELGPTGPVPAIEAVRSHPGIELRLSTRAWRIDAGAGTPASPHAALLVGAREPLCAPRLVLAPGAHDRPLPFDGWDLPGVMTPGGAQALMKGSDVLPGRRVLVAGSGPFLLAVAAQLVERRARVVGVLERRRDVLAAWASHPGAVAVGIAAGKAREGAGYLRTLRRGRVPLRAGWRVHAARAGADGAVAAASIGPDGAPAGWLTIDAVAAGDGFTAALELPAGAGCALGRDAADGSQVVRVDADGASSVPGILVAGEATGVGGADLAAVEGEVAGRVAAGAPISRALRARRAALRRFARSLRSVHAVGDAWAAALGDETVVCRCEEVTAGAIRRAVGDLGADDGRSVKLLSRAGMGLCQGRMCAANVEAVIAAALGHDVPDLGALAARPFAAPIALGDLASLAAGAPAD